MAYENSRSWKQEALVPRQQGKLAQASERTVWPAGFEVPGG